MAATRVRSSPSGKLVTVSLADVVLAEPRQVAPYAPTEAEPVSSVVVLRPAGHGAGIYLVSFAPVVLSIGMTTIVPFLSWSTPGSGLQIAPLPAFSTTALGARVTPSVSVDSDGAEPITLVCEATTPIIGAPLLELFGTANRLTIG